MGALELADSSIWSELKNLYLVRNAAMHAAGQYDQQGKDLRQYLEQSEHFEPGVLLPDIIPRETALQHVHTTACQYVDEIVDALEKTLGPDAHLADPS